MSDTIDINSLLHVLSEDAPCGPDLEYSPEYVELSRLIQGTPDVEIGKMHQEAAEPDWKAIKAAAIQLLQQSRDLRLAVYLTQALLSLHGFAGLVDGLALIDGLIATHWDHVHPQLDPDDGLDPTERVNSIAALNALTEPIRRTHLVRSVTYGPICLRDIEIVEGDVKPRKGEVPPKPQEIEVAFNSIPISQLKEIVGQAEAAYEGLQRIESLLAERVGVQHATQIEEPRKSLRRLADWLRPKLGLLPDDLLDQSDIGHTTDVFTGSQDDGMGHVSGELNSRNDVACMLDRICDYYARQEPGSPVPVLIRRARRLIDMDFMQIMNDLSPQSLAEINFLAGIHASRDAGGDAQESSFNPYGDLPHGE